MKDAGELAETVRLIWGKSGDQVSRWLPLWRHLADSCDVAGRLWDSWASSAVKRRICREIPGGDDAARTLVQWLAGVHDIGKATPAFAFQAPILRDRMRQHGFSFDQGVATERKLVPHATAGHVLLTDWLASRHGWERSQSESLASIVGGHHGVPPTDGDIKAVRDHPHLLGMDALWLAAQDELLVWMTRRTNAEKLLSQPYHLELSQPVQALLTGLVIMADWIASNEEFFPYDLAQLHDAGRSDGGWLGVDLPTPWQAVPVTTDPSALFQARFALPDGAVPYPVQVSVMEAARRMPVPGLLIVEAPMGEGKTEAALAAVEIIASRNSAGGCFVALPTRATSDAMFARVVAWLNGLPDQDIGRGAHDVALAHGKATLNTDFSTLYRYGLPTSIGVDEGGADIAVHRWLAGRKRKMLSNFAIGTIDQLLFAALKSRHVVLRHLGLAGKIVVIDEAHAYDVYMSSYLDRALHWLGAHGTPVVVLSATLPASRRAAMVQAYDDGRFGVAARHTFGPIADPYQTLRDDQRYPLLTYSGQDRQPETIACASSGRAVTIRLSRHEDDPVALASTLRECLVEGGCVLIVCNTVARVQLTATVLREQLGDSIPVSVAHSRFMGPDRAAKDRWLRDTFGSPTHMTRVGRARPTCHVVVASQVAEQSLDIDFDLLVTDLAPVDLLLQRMGRLHRHAGMPRPTRLAQPRCILTGADWACLPPEPVRGSVIVYGRSALLRSAGVLWSHLEHDRALALPGEIAPLVQAAYGAGSVGPPSWQPFLVEAAHHAARAEHDKRERATTFRLGPVRAARSLVGWLAGAAGDAETAQGNDARGRAHVRDDGSESLEVLVLVRRGNDLITPPWLATDGAVIVSTDFDPGPLSRTVASCSLALPKTMTAQDGLDQVIDELEQRHNYAAWRKNPWLDGELVLDLDERGRTQVAGFALEYDPDDGLRVTRLAEA